MSMESFFNEDGIARDARLYHEMSVVEESIPSSIVKNDLKNINEECEELDIEDLYPVIREITDSILHCLDEELAYLLTSRLRYFFSRDIKVFSLVREENPPIMDFENINNNDIPNNRYSVKVFVKDRDLGVNYEIEV